jgi:hypothetical protein
MCGHLGLRPLSPAHARSRQALVQGTHPLTRPLQSRLGSCRAPTKRSITPRRWDPIGRRRGRSSTPSTNTFNCPSPAPTAKVPSSLSPDDTTQRTCGCGPERTRCRACRVYVGCRAVIENKKEVPFKHFVGYLGTWSSLKTFREKHPEGPDPVQDLCPQCVTLHTHPHTSPHFIVHHSPDVRACLRVCVCGGR